MVNCYVSVYAGIQAYILVTPFISFVPTWESKCIYLRCIGATKPFCMFSLFLCGFSPATLVMWWLEIGCRCKWWHELMSYCVSPLIQRGDFEVHPCQIIPGKDYCYHVILIRKAVTKMDRSIEYTITAFPQMFCYGGEALISYVL